MKKCFIITYMPSLLNVFLLQKWAVMFHILWFICLLSINCTWVACVNYIYNNIWLVALKFEAIHLCYQFLWHYQIKAIPEHYRLFNIWYVFHFMSISWSILHVRVYTMRIWINECESRKAHQTFNRNSVLHCDQKGLQTQLWDNWKQMYLAFAKMHFKLQILKEKRKMCNVKNIWNISHNG